MIRARVEEALDALHELDLPAHAGKRTDRAGAFRGGTPVLTLASEWHGLVSFRSAAPPACRGRSRGRRGTLP